MASVTVNLTGYVSNLGQIAWNDSVSLGSMFSSSGSDQILNFIVLRDGGVVQIDLEGTADDFTSEFEATGHIVIAASDGETLTMMIANADITEPYNWIPDNVAEINTFITHVRGLADGNATLTLTDDLVNVAPSFTDDTGDDSAWIVGIAITDISVPEAIGTPTPTYAVVGNLPNGINFNTSTRVLSGTPTVAGSGTITIRSTNSEGSDDWTVDYTTVTAAALLSLSDFDQSGIDVVFAGLIIAGSDAQSGGTSVYVSDAAGVPWTATGILVDGNLDYDGSNAFTRLLFTSSVIRVNDNRTGDTGALSDFLNMPGMEIFLTVNESGETVTHRSTYTAVTPLGSNFFNLTLDDGPTNTAFRALAVGDRFIFAMGAPQSIVSLLPVMVVFPGVGGNISVAVTKTIAHTVAAAFPGIGGNFAVAVTKTIAYAVAATFPGTGGSLSVSVTQAIAVIFHPIAAVFPGVGGRVSVSPIVFTAAAPSFTNDMGNPQNWTENIPIVVIRVPTADGMPVPTYEVVGTLPDGISFDALSRTISGASTNVGPGVIIIRAINTEGYADWTVAYRTVGITLFHGQYTTPIERACEELERERLAVFSAAPFVHYERIDSSLFPSIALFNGLPVTILTLPPEVRANLLRDAGLLFDISGTLEAINVAASDLGMFINPVIEEVGGKRVVTLAISQPVYAISEESFARFMIPFFENLILPWTLPLKEIVFGHVLTGSIGAAGGIEHYERELAYGTAINS